MKMGRSILYVGTYTHGTSVGIHIYDMDVEKGTLKERRVVPINNASFLTQSHNKKYIYSICDEGVEAFRIMQDGDLEFINQKSIRGMRGCYLSTDSKDRLLFVGGYHDGKVTVLKLNKDGSIGPITDGIFHKGLGSIAERNFRPHVNAVVPTPDDKYLCAVDLGVDHVKVYSIDYETGRLRLVDIIHCPLESAPRGMVFSKDGRFCYVLCELKNYILAFSYDSSEGAPHFERIQKIGTITDKEASNTAASGMKITKDGKYLFCSNAGEDSIAAYAVNQEDGKLEMLFELPISGEYPKDLDIFPDLRHVIALNHESNAITTFTVHYEKKTLAMNSAPIYIETPNCALVVELEDMV